MLSSKSHWIANFDCKQIGCITSSHWPVHLIFCQHILISTKI
jgi:hypothetical protein